MWLRVTPAPWVRGVSDSPRDTSHDQLPIPVNVPLPPSGFSLTLGAPAPPAEAGLCLQARVSFAFTMMAVFRVGKQNLNCEVIPCVLSTWHLSLCYLLICYLLNINHTPGIIPGTFYSNSKYLNTFSDFGLCLAATEASIGVYCPHYGCQAGTSGTGLISVDTCAEEFSRQFCSWIPRPLLLKANLINSSCDLHA